jgi:hypothetical protein
MRAMILTEQKGVEEAPLTEREMDAPRAGRGEVRVKVSVCANGFGAKKDFLSADSANSLIWP